MTNVPTVTEARAMQHLALTRKERECIDEQMRLVQTANENCARAILSSINDGKYEAQCDNAVSQKFLSEIVGKGYKVSQWTREVYINDDDIGEVSGPLVKW